MSAFSAHKHRMKDGADGYPRMNAFMPLLISKNGVVSNEVGMEEAPFVVRS